MSDTDKHKGELRDYLVTKICYAMNDWMKDCDPSYLAGKYADQILATFEQTISTAVREALDSIKIPPVYKGDDSLGKEYQCGYNDMVIATELLIADIKSQIAQLKEGAEE